MKKNQEQRIAALEKKVQELAQELKASQQAKSVEHHYHHYWYSTIETPQIPWNPYPQPVITCVSTTVAI